MKAILYMSAVLMSGAILYGFVDYKKTSRSKDFNRMYEHEAVTEPVTAAPEIKTATVIEKKNSPAIKERAIVKRSGLKNKRDANLVKNSKRDVTPAATISIEKEESLPVLKDEKTESAIKEIKMKKKVNFRMYSRAELKGVSEKKPKKTKQ